MDGFKVLSVIGTGTYSDVYAAVDRDSGDEVALKRIKPDHTGSGAELPSALRHEIEAMTALQHPNVLRLVGVFKHSMHAVLVLQRAVCSLHTLLQVLGRPMTEVEVCAIMGQALSGVAHAHASGWVHRDIAPGNILCLPDGGVVVADWGQAVSHAPSDTPTVGSAAAGGGGGVRGGGSLDTLGLPQDAVGTRWYKSPELLYGDVEGSPPSDMWALGMVLAEALREGDPLCPGTNDISQLSLLVRTFGRPSPASWPGLTGLPDYGKLTFREVTPPPLPSLLPGVSGEGVEAVGGCLALPPHLRATAAELLSGAFFSAVTPDTAKAAVVGLLKEVTGRV